MDPYEQRLRDEVIYLHSLWHQGPPRNPNTVPFPVPVPPTIQPHFPLQHCSSSRNPNARRENLHISNPTPFKRKFGAKRNKMGLMGKDDFLAAASGTSDGGAEWPIPKTVVEPSPGFSEWPRAKTVASRTMPTAEETKRLAVLQMQYRVSDNFGEFLARTAGSDSDEASGEDDDVEDGGLEESEEYKFFLDVFVRDREMRDYYEKNWASGDFCCFVCGGAKKSGKKFKSCDALVQHSMSIAKTNRKRTHRALGLVICKVLGWDVNRLPAIVVKGEPLSRSLTSLVDIQCETKENMEVSEDVSAVGQCKGTVDVDKDHAGAVDSGELQCENVEIADINNNVTGVADNSVEMGNVNHEFGDREEGQALDDKQEHNKITILEKTVPKEVIMSKSVMNLDKGNGDMGVNEGELTDKMVRRFFAKDLALDADLLYLSREADGRRKFLSNQEQGFQRDRNSIRGGLDALPSGGEWPCQKVIANPNSAVHELLDLPSDSSSLAMLDEDAAKIAAEQNVLEACRDFFCREYGSECDRSGADEDYDDVTDGDDCEDGESEESKFFIKLFMGHTKLRTYYEKYHGDGDFLCLVCAGVGKKTWRRFKGCAGLLHHSNTVRKTLKKAHRSYARTVCKVLGWDIDQLPKVVRISEPLSTSLVGSTTDSSGVRLPCEESVLAEEKEKLAAEQQILKTCRDFFYCRYCSKCDVDEKEDKGDLMDEEKEKEEEEDEDVDGLIDGECEEFKFFEKLFTDKADLRCYYENSHADGDFLCLVCGAMKKKTARRFMGCIELFHHCNTIWKFKKKAHRAYARVVCKILGWDVERLPRIASVSEPVGQSIAGTQDSVPLPSSSAEWPCGDITGPESSQSEWPSLKLPSESVSSEEKEKLAAEQKVLEACRSFFRNKHGCELGEDEVDDEGGDLMDEDDEAEGVEEEDITDGDSEEFKFFVKLFTEDEMVRSFYENNHANGDFCCLVCAAVSKKSWKRFKGCAGLLNHSNTVLKTMRKAHRAYAKAVCRILGWDIKKLPTIAPMAEPLSGSLSQSDGLQDELKANADGTIIDSENSESKENS